MWEGKQWVYWERLWSQYAKGFRPSTNWTIEGRSTGWSVTGWLAATGGKVGWPAESRSTAQGREATDSITQVSEATGSTAHWVAASGSRAQGAAAAGPEAQRHRESRLAGTGECGGPQAVAGCLAGTGHHSLGPDGLTAGLLTVERGAQLAGAGRAEVSPVHQFAGEEGTWVVLVAPKGARREVSRAEAVGHVDRRCEFSWVTVRRFWVWMSLLHCGIYTLPARGVAHLGVMVPTWDFLFCICVIQ